MILRSRRYTPLLSLNFGLYYILFLNPLLFILAYSLAIESRYNNVPLPIGRVRASVDRHSIEAQLAEYQKRNWLAIKLQEPVIYVEIKISNRKPMNTHAFCPT